MRLKWIDRMKGTLIFFVVLLHLLGGLYRKNVVGEFWYNFANSINSFVMPAFIWVSGYTYSIALNKKNDKNIKKQILNMVMLYFIWEIIYLFYMIIIDRNNISQKINIGLFLNVFYSSYSVYWYIYILIVLYISVLLLRKIKFQIEYLVMFSLILVFIYFYFNLNCEITILRLFNFAFFFYLGIYFEKNKLFLNNTPILVISLISALIISYIQGFYGPNINIFIKTVLYILGTLFWIIALQGLYKKYEGLCLLEYIGSRSLEIFLLHLFVVALYRTTISWMVNNASIISQCFIIFFGVIIGLIVPLVLSRLFLKFGIYNYFFAPVKIEKNITKKNGGNNLNES